MNFRMNVFNGMEHVLDVGERLGFMEIMPNICALTLPGRVVGVCEVKCPGKVCGTSILLQPSVVGKLFDQLMYAEGLT
jgi:hypothetical protein